MPIKVGDFHWRATHSGRAAQYQAKYARAHAAQLAAAHREWRAANPAMCKAEHILARAVAKGRLVRPPNCTQCGQVGDIEGHHPDYAQPMVVVWLCKSCHVKADRERVSG